MFPPWRDRVPGGTGPVSNDLSNRKFYISARYFKESDSANITVMATDETKNRTPYMRYQGETVLGFSEITISYGTEAVIGPFRMRLTDNVHSRRYVTFWFDSQDIQFGFSIDETTGMLKGLLNSQQLPYPTEQFYF